MIEVASAPLGAIANVVRGVTFSKTEASSEPAAGFLPVLRAGNIQDSLLLDEDLVYVPRAKVNAKQLLRRGDIVICTSSGSADVVGKTAFAERDWEGSFGAFCAGIRANPKKCDPTYLFYYLRSPPFRSWTQKSSGANIKNIRKSELDPFEIPLPPLPEQRRIAAILDKADAIRRKRERTLAMIDELLKSVFLEMFGDPVKNPNHWPLKACGELCERITVGIVVRPASYYKSSGVPALRSLNIREGYISANNLVYFSHEDNDGPLSKTRIWQDDIVLVRSGQPGKAAIVPGELNGVNAIDILIVTASKAHILPEYLCTYYNSPGGRRLVLSEQRGQIQKHLNVASLNAALVPLPPLELQRRFVQVSKKIAKKKVLLAETLNFSNALFANLSQRAFRGEL